MNKEDKLFELYTVAELSYKKHFNTTKEEDLFPIGWYENKDYKSKIAIITEAIKTNTLIVNTPSYLNIIEGTVKVKEKNSN